MSSYYETVQGVENGLCHLRKGLKSSMDSAATVDSAHLAHSLNQTTLFFDGNV